jgi:hypothetical protein
VVVSSPLLFLELKHSAPPDLAHRLRYLSDPDAALKFQCHNTSELCLVKLQQHIDLGVAGLAQCAARPGCFLLYEPHGYVLSSLLAAGTSAHAIEGRGAEGLFLVHSDGAPP